MFFKRILLFGLVNILVVVTLSIVLRVLGIGNYITASGLNYEALAIFCLVWGMAGSFISLLLSKFMAKMMMGVTIVDSHGPYRDIVSMVYHYAKKAGIEKMPEVGVYESPEVNAFATGATKNSSLVAVSTGLLQRMNREEVEGVIGHEVAHIANGDMVTMTLVQGVVNAFVMFAARIVAFTLDQFLRGQDEEGRGLGHFAHMAVVFVCEILFGILGMMVVAYFSRWREFRADAGSAKLAGKQKMIQALRALQRTFEAVENGRPEFQTMKISSRKSWLNLFSTHPSLEDRIAALERNPL